MESSRSSGRQSERTHAETPCDSKAEFEHIAERLAFAGLRVLRMTCDTQEDARYRLGVTSSEGAIATRLFNPDLK